VLVAVWTAVVLFVLGNWVSRVRHDQRLEAVTKPAATIAIGALAMVVSDGAPAAAVVAGLIGFVFCLVGDVALMPQIDNFILGLGAFLIGHFAFVVMFVALGVDRLYLAAVIIGAIAVMGPFVVRRIISGAAAESSSLKLPVTAYFLVITAMAATGWATGLLAAVIGTALFVASDSILGWRAFVAPKPWMALAIMATYHGALIGLALSLA
jgi:uncharacterized membrane protein YhhN